MENDQEQREVASQSQLAFSKLKAFFLCLAVLCIWRLIQYVAKKKISVVQQRECHTLPGLAVKL